MNNSVDERQTRQLRNNISIASTIHGGLCEINEKIVFAESCTGGDVVATMTRIPGISSHLCGSIVSYRVKSKCDWIGVDHRSIDKHTAESMSVAREMALGVLKITAEASWALAVVGHLGPDAPIDEDGKIFIVLARRTVKGKIKIKDEVQDLIAKGDRVNRQMLATELCLTILARNILKRCSPRGAESKEAIS